MSYDNNRYGQYESTANRIAVGLLIIIISVISMLSLFDFIGGVGQMISKFLVGIFGLVSYAYAICGVVIGIAVTLGKRITLSADRIFKYILLFVLGITILHVWTTRGLILTLNYGGYLKEVYVTSTPAGFLCGIVAYPLMKLFTPAFLLVLLLILFFAAALASFYPLLKSNPQYRTKKVKIKPTKNQKPVLTDISREGREEKILQNEVGNSLFVGTIEEGGVVSSIKPSSKRNNKKSKGFSLLFPNQNNPLIDEDSFVDPIFENDNARKQRAREKLFGKKRDKNAASIKENKMESSVKTTKSENIKPSHKDVGKPSLPFTFNTEIGYNENPSSKTFKEKFNIDNSQEAIMKDVQSRFGYILDKDVTADDIRGAVSHRLAEPSTPKKEETLFEPEISEVVDKPQDNKIDEIPDDMPYFIREILYNDRKVAKTSKNETDNTKIDEPKNYDSHIENNTEIDNQKDDDSRGSIFDMNIFSSKTKKVNSKKENEIKGHIVSGSDNNAIMPDKNKIEQVENNPLNRDFLSRSKNTENKHRTYENQPQSSYNNNFPIGKNAKPVSISNKPVKKPKPQQISIEQSLEEQRLHTPYMAPPVNLLLDRTDSIKAEDYTERVAVLERTLLEFKIDAKVIGVTQGPTFSRFELRMPVGVSVNQVLKLENDLAMKLKASSLRFEAPIPGHDAFGIEIPNKKRSIVGLRSLISSEEYNTSKSPLTFSLGKDIANDNYVCDLESMPHMLIAGATGTGKSVCINSLIISLLYKCGPNDLKLVLVDPKKVELSLYSGLPHLLLREVIDEPEVAINALDWAIEEMKSRYNLFKKYEVRNITEYNKVASSTNGINKLPRVVFIIDELADFILVKKHEIEDRIGKITRLSRAAGIHLVVATQRPSVDIVTGTIKSNLPSRIAFAVKTSADSSTILGGGGAEKMLGKGDMLFAPQSMPEPIRLQGTFVERDEVKAVVDYIKNNNESYYDPEIEHKIFAAKEDEVQSNNSQDTSKNGDSKLFIDALKMFVNEKQASISKLQRKFNVGYGTAANVIEEMEERKYVSPNKGGNKTRDVLISKEQFYELYGRDDDDIEGFNE